MEGADPAVCAPAHRVARSLAVAVIRAQLVRAVAPCGLAVLAAAPATALADPPLLYAPLAGAAAASDALDGQTLRQAPALPDGRWGAERLVGKVSGRELSGLPPDAIAARLRAGWQEPGVGDLVAIDELTPRQWPPARAAALRAALDSMGADARRVIVYASPALVEQVGRAHPRRPLPRRLAALVDAASRARTTYLATYRGDLSPFPAREMATHPTRWLARWPAGRGGLRLTVGPDGGLGQPALWARVRASAAGRALLAGAPAGYGLRTAVDGRAWAEAYRAHLAAPASAPAGGDHPVTGGGGIVLRRLDAARATLSLRRPGRAVVRLVPRGERRGRVILKLRGPVGRVTIRPPRDAPPGRYRIVVVLQGDGIRDGRSVAVRLR